MEAKNAVRALGALAQETRLRIYRLLVQAGPQGMVVGDIARRASLAPATLSFHLKALRHAGLIEDRRDGRFIHYSANYVRMDALVGFLTENCCGGRQCAPVRRLAARA